MRPRVRTLPSRVRVLDTRAAPPAKKTAAPFYRSAEWRELMAHIIRKRGRRCEDPRCETPRRTGIRVFGDHIVELADGGEPLDEANILLRCGSCHSRKTAEERERRQQAPIHPERG